VVSLETYKLKLPEGKMREKMLMASLVLMLSVALVSAQVPFKKYDIKSGIITYDLIMKVGSMEIKQKVIVFFDDYGMKECKDTYQDSKLAESNFSDGKNLFALHHGKKQAFNRGTASRGTELRVEWSEFGTEKDRQSGKYKKISAKTIAGKSCEMFETDDGKGNITRYGGWNKIMLYMDTKMSGVQSTQQAVKVEENVKVPPEKFKVPEGYTLQ
jgi:hypothetical protein